MTSCRYSMDESEEMLTCGAAVNLILDSIIYNVVAQVELKNDSLNPSMIKGHIKLKGNYIDGVLVEMEINQEGDSIYHDANIDFSVEKSDTELKESKNVHFASPMITYQEYSLSGSTASTLFSTQEIDDNGFTSEATEVIETCINNNPLEELRKANQNIAKQNEIEKFDPAVDTSDEIDKQDKLHDVDKPSDINVALLNSEKSFPGSKAALLSISSEDIPCFNVKAIAIQLSVNDNLCENQTVSVKCEEILCSDSNTLMVGASENEVDINDKKHIDIFPNHEDIDTINMSSNLSSSQIKKCITPDQCSSVPKECFNMDCELTKLRVPEILSEKENIKKNFEFNSDCVNLTNYSAVNKLDVESTANKYPETSESIYSSIMTEILKNVCKRANSGFNFPNLFVTSVKDTEIEPSDSCSLTKLEDGYEKMNLNAGSQDESLHFITASQLYISQSSQELQETQDSDSESKSKSTTSEIKSLPNDKTSCRKRKIISNCENNDVPVKMSCLNGVDECQSYSDVQMVPDIETEIMHPDEDSDNHKTVANNSQEVTVYSCDLEICSNRGALLCQSVDQFSEINQSVLKGRKEASQESDDMENKRKTENNDKYEDNCQSSASSFTWKSGSLLNEGDRVVPDIQFQNGYDSGAVTYNPPPPCSSIRRLGLSRRQRVRTLHPTFRMAES